jgi:hypothetical protein
MKGDGPESIVISGVGRICPERTLRPMDKIIVFFASTSAGTYELVPIGGDPHFWVAGNYYTDGPSVADEIKRLIPQ